MKKKSRNGRIIEDGVPTITSIRSGKQKEIPDYDFYLINYELLYKRQIDLSKLKIEHLYVMRYSIFVLKQPKSIEQLKNLQE